MLPAKDASRVLNKIQDIYEYKKAQEGLEFDVLNNVEDEDFITYLESELDDPTKEFLHSGMKKVDGKNKKKVKGYRKDVINEKSNSGNFFSVKPIDGYIEYEIEFNNLLDTNDFGLSYSKEEAPTMKLAKIWFPNFDFEKLADKLEVDQGKLINRTICEKAKKMGYDGIKYGDVILQGL
jgi:hypothetical protein